jgi:PHS family inorganic phosphate transporter-like MFS transporter
MMAAVFSMQGAGQLAASLVALVTTVAFKDSFKHTTGNFSSCHDACQLAGDRAWRIIVGFGAVPAVFALYYRITIPETPRYTFDIAHDIEKADADVKAYRNNEKEGVVDPVSQQKTKQRMGTQLSLPPASWQDALVYFSKWKNFKVIFATCASWFFFDLAFYGITLNNSTVLSAIGFSNGNTIYVTLLHSAIGNLVLICAGSLPGYWLSVATMDNIGRKPLQVGGFFILTIIFSIIGFAYHSLSKGALLALYILAQFFFNFGPNSTTFIIPGECFPTRYRSTGHGISAAWGKIGSIVTQVIAQPLLSKGAQPGCSGSACSPWLNHLMQIFALFMLCGTLVSLLVPETKGRTLEELAGEGLTQLERNGTGSPNPESLLRRHNPFRGGRPAGFSWNRESYVAPKSIATGILGKRERVGIMTSPDLLPKKGGKVEQKHMRAMSDTSASGAGCSGSESSNGWVVKDPPEDDLYIQGSMSGVLPGWGAGWAVERNPRPNGKTRVESIKLQDVGKLLK